MSQDLFKGQCTFSLQYLFMMNSLKLLSTGKLNIKNLHLIILYSTKKIILIVSTIILIFNFVKKIQKLTSKRSHL